MAHYEEIDAPVRGGTLRAGRWTADAPDAPVVVAAHGVTANHRCWQGVARETSCTLVAPDLRGRGRSGALPGPAGMAQHADDLRDLLDHLGQERATVLGHSMGGFVVAAFAHRHPDRCAGVVLVDGGLPLPPLPEGVTAEQALAATIGPAAARLEMTFPSPEAYLDYWRPHPAVGPLWSPELEDYLLYDLDGDRSSVSLAAVRDDSADLLDHELTTTWARSLPDGTPFLRAPLGLMAGPGGLYAEAVAEQLRRDFPGVRMADVAGLDHYAIVFAPDGAKAIAAAVDEVATGPAAAR